MQIKQDKTEVFNAGKFKVAIVVARFNNEITSKLLESASRVLSEYQVKEKNIRIISVPGSVEIPYVLAGLARTKKYNCLVALGAVIKGETDHYTYVCKMIQEGVLRVMLDYTIPVGFGILTTNNLEQAQARVDFGANAVRAALELVNLKI